jgi:hypothetical protein
MILKTGLPVLELCFSLSEVEGALELKAGCSLHASTHGKETQADPWVEE